METTLSKEQIKKKLGRFSASGAHNLMVGGRRDMTLDELFEEKKAGGKRKTVDTLFGDTAITYIYEKVAEILTGELKTFKPTAEIYRGIKMEPIAKKYFTAATGFKVLEFGTKNDENTAWSIDGWVNEFNTGIEILCPNSNNHLKYLDGAIKTIKENYPVKYWQITFYAWKYNRPNWKFISFDPRFKKDEHKMLVMDFPINQEDKENLMMRVGQATLIKNNIISKLK